jgi:ABC-2 type transport system ATP-binding protein
VETAPPDPILVLSGLSKRFGARVAVDDVSLTVHRGRIHGLLGPNGAGKTTTLRMVLGVVRPDLGTIELDGRALTPDVPRGRCGIAGFVETPNFYPYLSASRNLELLSAWDGPMAHRKVEELLERVGLADRAHSRVRGFSTGMRQRLGLAAALISDPQVLVVDEPTTGLDPAGIRDLHALLTQLAAAGHTIVLSSHDLAEVDQLCTDVSVLRSGAVVYDGTMTALRDRAPAHAWRLRTSDDERAAELATGQAQLSVHPGSGALMVAAGTAELDDYVIALAAAGVAVRELRREDLPFESLFFQLTEPASDPPQPLLSGRSDQ